ncbi:MAG: ABC transporter substrate-binding protein, partial [Gemmatimonadota bacterium]|nr:ABC transporter substrate-binding protein [Gemmatimonadota bacterium]
MRNTPREFPMQVRFSATPPPPVTASVKRLMFFTWLLSGTFAVGCEPPRPDSGPDRSSAGIGGTIIDAIPTSTETFFPPAASNSLDLAVINSVFDHLADIGDSLNTVGDAGFVPQLATGWKWANDSLSIAFSLNPKARWHDGAPVNAEDVRFTFKVYSDKRSGSDSPQNVALIDSVSIRDSLTPVVWFTRRTPHQFFDATYQMYVLPSHILGKVALEKMAADSFSINPVGTGRFRFMRR